MDDKEKMIIIGHIDHGVTTLVNKIKEMDGSVRDMSNDLIDKSLKSLSEIKKENETFLFKNTYKDLDFDSPIVKIRKQNNTKHKPRKKKSKSFGKNKKK